MTRSISRLALAIIFCFLMSCAGVCQYPLGMPSSASPQFFPAMEAVASAHGMRISKHPDSLNLQTSEGDWLQYMIKGNQIDLVIIPNTDGATDKQIEIRQAKLKALSDQLITEAQGTAERAKAFQ